MALPMTGSPPWVMLCLHFMFSTTGFWYSLSPMYSNKAADTLQRVLQDSSPAAMEEAKQLSNQMLDDVLQSQLSTFFLLNCFTSISACAVLVTKVVFLGRLTVIETNKLTERLMMFVLLKIVFFGAVVNPTARDVGAWLTWFIAMGYLKMFVGLAGDRCEALLSSPSSGLLQHLRCLVLLVGILVHMMGWMVEYVGGMGKGAGLGNALLWLFDGATVVVEAAHGIIKYGVHALERWRSLRAEQRGEDGVGPWEWQGSFLYHLELVSDMVLHVLTLAHYVHLWAVHGLRFQLIDMVLFLDIRYVAVVIWRRLRGYRRYRRLTKLVQHRFPDADAQQLDGNECAICMERMKSAKVLPCRHVFHVSCLRAWLQQSREGWFSCPMCRASLLDDGTLHAIISEQGARTAGGASWALEAGRAAASHQGYEDWEQAHEWSMIQQEQQEEEEEALGGEPRAMPQVEPVGALLAALLSASGAAPRAGRMAAGGGGGGSSGPGSLLGEAAGGQRAGNNGFGGGAHATGADHDLWAAVQQHTSDREEATSGITLTADSLGRNASRGAGSTLPSHSRSHGAGPTGSTCCGRLRLALSNVEADEEDTAAGPAFQHHHHSHPQQQPAAAADSRSRRPLPAYIGAEAEAGAAPGEGNRTAEEGMAAVVAAAAAAAALDLAAQSLRTVSRAVSELARSVGQQALLGHEGIVDRDAEGEIGEEGVVNQRPQQQPSTLGRQVRSGGTTSTGNGPFVRHRYSTRSNVALE